MSPTRYEFVPPPERVISSSQSLFECHLFSSTPIIPNVYHMLASWTGFAQLAGTWDLLTCQPSGAIAQHCTKQMSNLPGK